MDYDVLLSYPRADEGASCEETRRVRQQVGHLKERLSRVGLRVHDDEELIPGESWQEWFEAVVETVPVAAIILGTRDLGPWERLKKGVLTSQYTKRELRLIPVLLEGGPGADELPPFLNAFTRVELRDGLEERGFRQLVWGIRHASSTEVEWGFARYGDNPQRKLLAGVLQYAEGFLVGPGSPLARTALDPSRPPTLLTLKCHRVASMGEAFGIPISEDINLLDWNQDKYREILILGDPGSGKSTLLHELASEAVSRAAHPFEPLPVVLELARWKGALIPSTSAEARGDHFRKWLIAQIQDRYEIRPRISRAWERSRQLTLFLDGFDQVERRYRNDCLRAIRGYCRTRGPVHVVMTSRPNELVAAMKSTGEDLGAWEKIALQSLEDQQVIQWLEAGSGERVKALQPVRDAIEQEPNLGELAHSPLWLALMTRDPRALAEILDSGDEKAPGDLKVRILDHCVDPRPGPGTGAFLTPTDRLQLSWLARVLVDHGLDDFYLEDLQPSWLDSPDARRSYLALTRGLVGLVLAVPWLALLWSPSKPFGFALPVLGLAGGLVTACIDGVWPELSRRRSALPLDETTRWRTVGYGTALGAGWATIGFALCEFAETPWPAVVLLASFLWMFFFLQGRREVAHEVRTYSFDWSLPREWRFPGLLFLLVVATGVAWKYLDFVTSLVLTVVVTVGAVLCCVFWVFQTKRTRHDKGLRPGSALVATRNSAVVAGLLSVFTVLVLRLIYFIRWPDDALLFHLGHALLISLPLTLAIGFAFGGYDLLRYGLLRCILAFLERIPYRWVPFLDRAARAGILRKEGRGYRFFHLVLRDHMASRVVDYRNALLNERERR